jgi:transposase
MQLSKTGNRYTTEFKKQAIARIRHTDQSISETAKYLNISDQTLRNWIKNSNDLKRASRLRVKQLEKELKETKRRLNEMEVSNKLLVKATAILAEKKQ